MEMDFHSVVMQGPFWSHTSYCILTQWGLGGKGGWCCAGGRGGGGAAGAGGLGSSECLLYIKALNSLRRLHPYNSIISQRPHLWIP